LESPFELAADFPITVPAVKIPDARISPERWAQIRANAKAQKVLLESDQIFKSTIEAKLRLGGAEGICEAREESWFGNFLRCGVEAYYRMCEICGHGEELPYSCGNKFCPLCAWKISLKRKRLIETMTREIYDVKHVVLTQRNFEENLSAKIRESRKNLLKLRRQDVFGKVTGGCCSMEITNEDVGWHLHWHLLVQSKFVDAQRLALAWGKLVGQEYAIVKVLTVDDKSYVAEICKYVAKGSQIASWTPDQIIEFICALRDVRTFSTFGKFRQLQKFARALNEIDKPDPRQCDCGSDEFVVAESEFKCREIIRKLHHE
jgi:hypothetical protein